MSQQQDSLRELDLKIAAKQEQLHSLEQATQTAQNQWDDRKKQIAEDTKVQITAAKDGIKSALKAEQVQLDTLKQHVKAAEEAETKRQIAANERISQLEATGDEVERSNKVLQTTNATLRKENQTLTSTIAVNQQAIEELQAEETELSRTISQLKTDKDNAGKQLDTINGQVQAKTESLATLNEQFDTTKADTERQIGVLNQKKQAVTQEILDNKAQDDKVRDNLADWAKKLEEQDKNLRIREAQVNMQQQAIARNANLLNL